MPRPVALPRKVRWPLRSLVALGLTLLLGANAAASHESRNLVPAGVLDDAPYRGLVLITVSGATRTASCTGFVIRRHKVATAAHCLTRDPEEGDYRLRASVPEGVTVYRAYSAVAAGSAHPCAVRKAWAHPRFVKSSSTDTSYGSRSHDYAVLTTVDSCTYPGDSILRMRTTTYAGGQLPDGARIHAAGYPSDPRFGDMDGLHLWHSQGHVEAASFDPGRLWFTGYVGHGMSGGPVWTVHSGTSPCGQRHCVAGIITECEVNSQGLCRLKLSPRRAVRITPAVRDDLTSH